MQTELLSGFPVVVELAVQWGEMDALGHVNNAVYFRYLESGRMEYFSRLGLFDDIRESGVGPILHSVNCRFRIPLTYPDRLAVGTRVVDVGVDRFTMQSRVISLGRNGIAAESHSVIVMVDYRAGKKSIVPDALREKIANLEKSS